MYRKKTKGFTLIELLVVMSIISFLSSIIFATVDTTRARARDARRISDLKQIQNAVELYRTSNPSYPSTGGAWWGNCSTYGSHPVSGSNGYVPGVAPVYISVLPLDPKPIGADGCYLYNSNGTDYMILAHTTFEGSAPNSLKRPNWPTQQSIAIYTPGASTW